MIDFLEDKAWEIYDGFRAFLKKIVIPKPGKNQPLPLPAKAAVGLDQYFWGFEVEAGQLALGEAQVRNYETGLIDTHVKGINEEYRSIHSYVLGASGYGKTKFLESFIIQDIKNNNGFAVIDPHGDFVDDVKGLLYLFSSKSLEEEMVVIDPIDPYSTISFNPLEPVEGVPPEELAAELVEVFHKIWAESWGPRMADILRNTLIVLIENNLTLVELPLFLTNKAVRKRLLQNVKNPMCRQRFEYFDSLNPSVWREWQESTLNKVNAFLADPRTRQIFTARKSSFNLREIMDNKKILLVKLNRGRLKEGAYLLGALLVCKIQMAAFSRSDIADSERVPFYFYIDEFQNFATDSFVETLSEARKYKLILILAHQNLTQVPKKLQDSILTNCSIQACFRVNREDAQVMAKEMMSPLYTQPPGWEINIQALQELHRQECFIANRMESGITFTHTLKVLKAYEIVNELEKESYTDKAFKDRLYSMGFGQNYLVDRDEIEEEYNERTKSLLAEEEPESFRESGASEI